MWLENESAVDKKTVDSDDRRADCLRKQIIRIERVDKEIYDARIKCKVAEGEQDICYELRAQALWRMISERPILLEDEPDKHSGEKPGNGAEKVWHPKYIENVKCTEVYADADCARNEEFQNTHGAIVAPGKVR